MILFKKIFPVVLLMGFHVAFGQAVEKKTKNKRFKVWVYTEAEAPIAVGYLYEVLDSSIIVLKEKEKGRKSTKTPMVKEEIKFNKILILKFRRKGAGKVIKRVLLGGIIGFVSGGIVGLIIGKSSCRPGEWCVVSAEYIALVLGTISVVPGMIAGGVLGGTKTEIKPILGSWIKFDHLRSELEARITRSKSNFR